MKSFVCENACLPKFLKDLKWAVLINEGKNLVWQNLWLATFFFSLPDLYALIL